nr:zinc finger BED domain-containing protein RICESLEEPER 2 [Tanacetum cinerariifolium]
MMVKLSVDLNEPKDSSKTDKAAQNDMVVKLGYDVEDLMYYHLLIPSLGLDYGLHSLNVDVDVLEMTKYVKDYKIILVYVEHESSNPSSSVEAPIVVECAEDPFEELDDILGEYAHIRKRITGNEITRNEIIRNESIGNESIGNEITGKQMVVHVGNSSTIDDVLELEMLFETEGVGPVGKFKEVEVDADNESEEESDTEGDYTMDNPKHDTSIGGVDFQDDDLDVIDYDSYGIDLDYGIDSKRRMQLRKLRRKGKQKNKGPNKYCFYLGPTICHIHENMKSQFKGGVYKEMLWNAAKATSKGEFKKKMGVLKSFNSDAYDWLMKIPLKQWSRTQFLGRAKCDLLINNIFDRRIVVVQKVIAKTVGPLTPYVTQMFDAIKKRLLSTMLNGMKELTGIPCKHAVATIYNMSENSVGVNPCNERDMWPVGESRTVIIPPLYKPLIGRPPKKRKKSNDEIASQSASPGKLSRKGKSLSCGKCGNVGHNRKGCRGQGDGSSQAGARKVSGQAAGTTNVSGQPASARKVYGQAAGAKNVSGQAAGARKVSSQAAGSRKVFGQAADARKASSQPNAAQSTTKQRPRQGFQGPIAEEKNKLRETLQKNIGRVCLTTDGWTSNKKKSFMAHFIDNQWKLVKKVLNFRELDGHQGIDIGKGVESGLRKWMHIRCAAHVVNLIVQDELRSSLNAPKVLDVIALRVRYDLEDVEFGNHIRRKGHSVPTSGDWIKAKKLCHFLTVFYEITLRISVTTYVTSHTLVNELATIRALLRKQLDCDIHGETPTDKHLYDIAKVMQPKFDKYYREIMCVFMLHLLLLLQPHVKGKGPRTKTSDEPDHGDILRSKMKRGQSSNSSTSELDKYVGEICEPFHKSVHFDILQWWKNLDAFVDDTINDEGASLEVSFKCDNRGEAYKLQTKHDVYRPSFLSPLKKRFER